LRGVKVIAVLPPLRLPPTAPKEMCARCAPPVKALGSGRASLRWRRAVAEGECLPANRTDPADRAWPPSPRCSTLDVRPPWPGRGRARGCDAGLVEVRAEALVRLGYPAAVDLELAFIAMVGDKTITAGLASESEIERRLSNRVPVGLASPGRRSSRSRPCPRS